VNGGINSQNNWIYNALDNFLTQRLALRKGERLLVFLLQMCICLIISVLLILKPLFSGMMLSAYSVEIIPLAFVLIAVTAVVVHVALNVLQSGKSLFTSILVNQFVHIAILIGIGLIIHIGVVPRWMNLVLYVYASLYAVVTVSFFYQYCQSILTIRDAKRLYGYIGAGAIAGGIAGGYLTNVLIEGLGKSGLLYLSAGFLVLITVIYYYINKLDTEDLELDFVRQAKKLVVPHAISLLKNNHIFNIAMLMGLGVIVSRLVDYQFSYLALEHVATSDDLASFFGFWFSTINVIGFIIQLFIVHAVIDRYGVTKSLLGMPIFLLVGLILLLFFPVLIFGIMLKSFDGSLKQSVYKTSTELVIMPLRPSLRRKAKTFIDVVVDSLSTGIAGVLIYFVGNVQGLSFVSINLLTLGICCAWIFFIFRSSKTYNKVLLRQIEMGHTEVKGKNQISNLEYIKSYVNNNRNNGISVKASLKELTNHENQSIRVLALREYGQRYRDSDRSMVYDMAQSSNSHLKEEAFHIILSWSKTPQLIDTLYIKTALVDQPYLIKALADALNHKIQIRKYKVHQKIEQTYEKIMEQHYNDEYIINEAIDKLYKAAVISRYEKFYPHIEAELLTQISPQTQLAAIEAISYGADPYFFERLRIEDIHHSNQEAYYRCLATFPSRLLHLLRSNIHNAKVLLQYLPACSYIDSQKSVNFLFRLLDHKNIRIRRKSLYTINYLKKNFDYLNYNNLRTKAKLLSEIRYLKKLIATDYFISNAPHDNAYMPNIKRGLMRELNSALVRVFIYIGLVTERDDMGAIYSAMKDDRKESALDILDSILPYKWRKRIVPILEATVSKKWDIDDLRVLGIQIPKRRKVYKFINSMTDSKLKEALKKYVRTASDINN